MPTALLTGITGQTGSYLAEQLLASGWEVCGLYRDDGPDTAAVRANAPRARLLQCDLADLDAVARAVMSIAPDTIFNLGGLSSVALSWERPLDVARVNGLATAGLLEASWELRRSGGSEVAFVQASSAEMFGYPDEVPQSESTPIRPTNPYGASKAFAHHLVGVYRRRGLKASSCILYNHESPRRPEDFVTRKISRGVAAIAMGLQSELVLGNLDARRDWGWAPDYARAIALSTRLPGDYVIATGVAHSVRDFVIAAFAAIGIADWEQFVVQDPELMRPSDSPELVGDAARARLELGWEPSVGFEELVTNMVDHDLAELQQTSG
jgi:GDPmannose 4,6-dehydratase